MSLPEWVLPFKEPHTEIKCIKGNYYKYEVKSVYDASKKHSVKKTIRLLGKVSEKNGFVPSSKNVLREAAQNPKVDIKTYGVYYGCFIKFIIIFCINISGTTVELS